MTKLTSTADDKNAADLEQELLTVNGNARTVHFARQLGSFFQNKYTPTIMILSVYTNEMNIYVYTKFCVWMLIVTSVVIAKSWKQSSLSMDTLHRHGTTFRTIGNAYQTVRWQGGK